MPLKVETISDPKKHIPQGATLREGAKKIKELAPGQAAMGTIGEPDAPETVVEMPEMTPEEEVERAILANLLIKWVSPPKLAKNSKPDLDTKSFISKVRKQSLEDLRRFFNVDLPEDVRAVIQKQWKDLSP